MSKIIRQRPIEREIKLDPSEIIMSKTDAKGIIEYANEYFMKICGYSEGELMGQPHNVIRHPDMPRVIFKLLWDRLHEGKNIHALVKNLAKDGRYYWVLTSFQTKYDDTGKIISHYSRRKAAPADAVYYIEKLYRVLLSLERSHGLSITEKYLQGMFEEKQVTYDEFILKILNTDQESLESLFFNYRDY